jgi:hypothetical protein
MRVDVGRQFTELELVAAEQSARSATAGMNTAARAEVVNRTHRVIRERANKLQTQRNQVRSLWIPLGVCTALLVTLACALWTAFEDFEGSTAGLPNTSGMVVVLVWSVPISAMILAVIWSRRNSAGSENERVR